MAYRTLHYILVRLSLVMAPFTPFLSEELYCKLTGGESVHLLDWPEPGEVNELLIQDMSRARDYITVGLAQRAAAGIKVRQPLKQVTVPELPEFYRDIIQEELNVKEVVWTQQLDSVELDLELTPELRREGQVREVIRQVQNSRKLAGLQVDDRISLVISTDNRELERAIHEHADMIRQETLATHLTKEGSGDFETTVQVEGHDLHIKVQKS